MSEQELFGRWVKRRRNRLDLTQRALAAQVGCAAITIRKIEADQLRPSRQVALRLSDVLELQPAERAAFVAAARGEYIDHAPLPPLLTPLVGREEATAQVCDRLLRDDVRLLTLIGPPGIGKTSLALQVAALLQPHFSDGAVWVALADIRAPELLVGSIAEALGLHESGDRPIRQRLHAMLRDRQLLVVLDNFEQVLSAAAELASLLGAAAQVKLLVTSRAVLRINGEHAQPVPPLALPDTAAPLAPAEAGRSAAVQLFVQRAVAVDPSFELTVDNAAAVVAICTRMDGLPLAIELAAARTRLWTAQELLARLDRPPAEQAQQLLTGGRRDQPARQQSLHNAIDWSYRLLDENERRLFRRLSAFAGGFTLDAAEQVAVADTLAPAAPAVSDLLQSLLDNSLVQRRPDEAIAGTQRYGMLETLREFATAQLDASPEADAVRERHAGYVLEMAQSAERACYAGDWLQILEREHGNVRAALAWLSRPAMPADIARVERGLRLAGALDRFWFARGHVTEGRQWLAQLLVQAGEAASAPLRAQALINAGFLAWFQSDCPQAAWYLLAGQALFESLGDRLGQAWTLLGRARVARYIRDYAAGESYCRTAYALFSAANDAVGRGWVANERGQIALMREQNEHAAEQFSHSRALFEAVDQVDGIADALWGLGSAALAQEKYAEAAAAYGESLVLWRASGEKLGCAGALAGLGSVALGQRQYKQAQALLQEGLAIHWELGNTWGLAQDLAALAAAESAHHVRGVHPGLQLERALRILAAVHALQHRTGVPLWPVYQTLAVRTEAHARVRLSAASAAAAWAEGSRMPLADLIAMVQS